MDAAERGLTVCGIVGLVGSDTAIEELTSIVQTMVARSRHRGPDDCGTWVGDNVALGHARLSILDTSARGRQPFVTDDESGVIVFNGEVFNFRELRAELEAEGICFRSDTDTEVVLNALHRWGVETAVPRFNGMFAFAYFDRRDGSLWLARDRMGIKPLFVSMSCGGLAFASEQKALRAHPGIGCDVDAHAMASLLLYERFDTTHTPFADIESFLPGRILCYRDGKSKWLTYFDLARDLDLPAMAESNRRFDDSAAAFERLLGDSVARHLISDVPLATMCSGGLDSSLVTVLAARELGTLVSYVADIEGMRGEELRRAGIVAGAAGAELRPVHVDRRLFLSSLPEAVAANDQPLFFSQDVAAMLISRQMQADGFKVILTGDGADELFGGYSWYAKAYARWARLQLKARWIPDVGLTRWLGSKIPGLRPVDLDREIAGYQLTDEPVEYMSTSFNMAVVGGMNRTLRQREIFERLSGFSAAQRAFLSRNIDDVYLHLRECLNTLDKMTMRNGIEARVPFLENDLIQFGFGLPVSHKYHGGISKRVVHQLAGKLLPKSVVDLPKIGFTMPPAMWRGLEGFFVEGRIAGMLKWPRGKREEIVGLLRRKPYYCFRLLGSEIWLRSAVDGEAADSLANELLVMAGLEP